MAIEDRRQRERLARRRLITATARRLAESEGWDAVTTRRLSTEIEYSQPVLYKHFGSMEEIVEAVALEGFDELAAALRDARRDTEPGSAIARAAAAFTAFATTNPALYDAMFTRATRLRFAAADTPAPLTGSFMALREAVASTATPAEDVDTRTEVLWAALHGLVVLDRDARLRPGHAAARLDALIARFEA